jgi:hypothetical protein
MDDMRVWMHSVTQECSSVQRKLGGLFFRSVLVANWVPVNDVMCRAFVIWWKWFRNTRDCGQCFTKHTFRSEFTYVFRRSGSCIRSVRTNWRKSELWSHQWRILANISWGISGYIPLQWWVQWMPSSLLSRECKHVNLPCLIRVLC